MMGELDSHMKSMKLETKFSPYRKINSKWLKDLNIRHDSMKLLGESIGKTFSDQCFLRLVPKGN